MEEYIKCRGEKANCIKVQLEYKRGGMNYFDYTVKPRGYYIYAQPMERYVKDNGIVTESYTAYTGYQKLLVECQRRNKKSEKDALQLYEETKKLMIDKLTKDLNLTLE